MLERKRTISTFMDFAIPLLSAAPVSLEKDFSLREGHEILMAASGLSRLDLLEKERPLDNDVWQKAHDILSRRLMHEPLSRITSAREFWGLRFELNEATLDPRPDSETVIEAALKIFATSAPERILDIGTGSGCLLISLLSEYQKAQGQGVDREQRALAQAHKNAIDLGFATRVQFTELNFFELDWTSLCKGPFDLIVSNPPYISAGDLEMLHPNVKFFDPLLALDGGTDGLDAYRAIVPGCLPLLKSGGWLLLEIGYDQNDAVQKILAQAGYQTPLVFKDLGDHIRVIGAQFQK